MSQAADWGLRFQELAADAGQMYARSLRRYNELLERIVRKELTPEEIHRAFREYLQDQTSASTRSLVELSVGLLAGLLHLESRYRDALLDGLVPPAAPPPPPPEAVDLADWFKALAAYSSRQSARSIARHQQLVDRVAAGQVSPQAVKEQGQRFLEQHAPAFLGDVMNLGLTFVGRMQRWSSDLADGLYDRVLGADDANVAGLEPPVCVDLHAIAGGMASATIVVENTRSETAEVVCRVSDFVARTGGDRFRPALDIAPARFRLAPQEQQDVGIDLTMDGVYFDAGTDYIATLLIAGAGEQDLIVQLIARLDREPPNADSSGIRSGS